MLPRGVKGKYLYIIWRLWFGVSKCAIVVRCACFSGGSSLWHSLLYRRMAFEECVQFMPTCISLFHSQLVAGLYLTRVGYWILQKASKHARLYAGNSVCHYSQLNINKKWFSLFFFCLYTLHKQYQSLNNRQIFATEIFKPQLLSSNAPLLHTRPTKLH